MASHTGEYPGDKDAAAKDAEIFAGFCGKTVSKIIRKPSYEDDKEEFAGYGDNDLLIVEFTDGSRLVLRSSDHSGYASEINLIEPKPQYS